MRIDNRWVSDVDRALAALTDPPCLLSLQEFLWGALPTWAVDAHEVAWGLADYFESAGLPAYAAFCRDRHTHVLIAAWPARVTEALEASDVRPPDTGVLVFGDVRGPVETAAWFELSRALEASHEPDRVALCQRLAPTYLPGVRRERAEAWVMRLRGDPGWLTGILPLLESVSGLPENVELSLVPARAVLEQVGDGVSLTADGGLPVKAAVELNDRFRWYDVVGRAVQDERDLPELVVVREHLTAQGLLAVRDGVLSVTAQGKVCLGDDEEFWTRLTDLRPRWDEFSQEVMAVAAALLLEAPDVQRDDLTTEVSERIRHRWNSAAEFDIAVQWAYLDWYRVGLALGWWDARRGRWLDRLSPRGVAAAARAFWSVAGQPT